MVSNRNNADDQQSDRAQPKHDKCDRYERANDLIECHLVLSPRRAWAICCYNPRTALIALYALLI